MKVQPYNIEAEKAVLGAMLVDKEVVIDVLKVLNTEDFYAEEHKKIFNTIKDMHYNKKPVDVITVSESMGEGLEYVSMLCDGVFTTTNVKHYTKLIKDKSVRRMLIKKCAEITDLAYESQVEETTELINKAKEKLALDCHDKCHVEDFQEILINTFNDIEKNYKETQDTKFFTGIKKYDGIMAGLHPEELTIIGARPAVGKTTFGIQIMINLAAKGVKTLFVSREMSNIQIAKRIISNISRVNGHKLRLCKMLGDDDWVKISQTVGTMSNWPILINDRLSTIQEIRGHCQTLKDKDKLDVLFVDYLGLLKTYKKCESKRLEIESISRELKEISLDLHIPVVCLSQLSRANEKDNREPKLSDLRESGSIEQDADNVILLHNDTEDTQEQTELRLKVIVAKQRNGATGYFHLKYYPQVFKFYDT